MHLPDALGPWREWLQWLAPDYLPLFADLLGRLDPLLGPLAGRMRGGVAEPDGLGDLQRRGHYQRLLASEWLLAEEMPDEFLRRASAGEHLFLAPQYRQRRANRLTLVLFDAGPLQLGAARLVHIALLILLARRAREAGAELRWGIAQEPPDLRELDGQAAFTRLLKARTWQPLQAGHWHAWRDWLEQRDEAVGECWLVGQRLPATEREACSHRVSIQRNFDGESLSLELQAAQVQRVVLPLPDKRLAVALLQDMAAPSATVPLAIVPRISLGLEPVISPSGTHVALRLLDQPGVALIKLPVAGQKKPLEVRSMPWSAGRSPLALTFVSRSIGAVLSGENKLWFWNLPGLLPIDKPPREQLQLSPGTATLLPLAWLRDQDRGGLLLLDSQGHLAFWAACSKGSAGGPAQPRFLLEGVLGMAQVGWGIAAYVRNNGGRLYAHSLGADGAQLCIEPVGEAAQVRQVLFAATPQWRHQFGGCALGSLVNDCEVWQVLPAAAGSAQATRISLGHGCKGVGLVLEQGHYALLVKGSDAHTLTLYTQGRQQVLFSTSARIEKVSFCPMSGLLAVLTRSRELLVYALGERRMRLQVTCGHAPASPMSLTTHHHPLKEDADARA